MEDENVPKTTENTELTGTTESVHLVARNPSEMASSQAHLAVWFTKKVAQCEQEAAELVEAVDVARNNKWDFKTLQSQAVRAISRKQFYAKCLAAVEAGYTIIPNIPVDVFAIRVKREKPVGGYVETKAEKPSSWDTPRVGEQSPQVLPVGEGNYRSPVSMVQREKTTEVKDGKTLVVQSAWPVDFADIEFPIIAAVPSVMTATQEAMTCCIFDEIGVSPQNTRKGDPLIIGHILGPKSGYGQRKTVSFLIVWYLDMRVL